MALSGTSLVPAGLGALILMMAVFGSVAYAFYDAGATWKGLGIFAGLVVAFVIFLRSLRGFFGKYSGKLVFGSWLIAILGAFFAYLTVTNKYPMGIDLAGGTELIYTLDPTPAQETIAKLEQAKKEKANDARAIQEINYQIESVQASIATASDKAAEVVRRRVDPTGTKGIPVTTFGRDRDRLRIQLPEAPKEEVERIKTAIRTQGRLSFHIVPKSEEITQKTLSSPTQISPDGLYEAKVIETPKKIIGGEPDKETVVIERVPRMDGSRVTVAVARRGQEGNNWEIGVRFDPAGQAEFAKLTGDHVGYRMAVVLDGVAKLAPVIQTRIDGECQITGNFTKEEAESVANVLTAGSLPVDVKLESEFTVGPSLGEQQIESGMMATMLATGGVVAFIIFYYRLAGVIAALCMLLNLPMLLGLMGFFKATLTLPGIAGMVLTLGMAVDANVLINERLREELQRGRSLKLATSHGFDRAFLTIIDCQLTTLISAIILYYLGTGPVRGFAVTLSLGCLTTLFCNLWLNWVITEWMVNREAFQKLNMMQFFATPKFDFMSVRKPWIAGSVALAIGSMALVAALTPSGRIYDVDFTGGTLVQFNLQQGKALDEQKAKEMVEREVREDLKKRAADTLAILNENRGKSGPDLRAALAAKLPSGGTIADEAVAREGGLERVIQELQTEQAKLANVDLTTQSFGEQAAGGGYNSFTLTTRLNNPVIIELLNRSIKDRFKESLEPEPVVVADKGAALSLPTPGQTAEQVSEKVKKALGEAAKDPANAPIASALSAVAVTGVESRDGRTVATLAPLPEDGALRSSVLKAVEKANVEAGATVLPAQSLLVRFANTGKTQPDVIQKNAEAKLLEAAKDKANAGVMNDLTALKVSRPELKDGYYVSELSPLPPDPQARERLVRTVSTIRLPERVEGPISRTSGFGSQVAGEMFWQALLALILANLGVFAYLWFRFEFSGAWGFGAIAALIHDVSVAAGAVVVAHLLGFPILVNLNIIAALLTIIGFSVNDTIVVFDRIREVKAAHPTRQYEDIVNEAVNQTLSRTVLTSLTVIIADLCLLAFGGPTIRDMAFTLLIGFLVGTYSSIFVASPLMIWWFRRFGTGKAPALAPARPAGDVAPTGAQV